MGNEELHIHLMGGEFPEGKHMSRGWACFFLLCIAVIMFIFGMWGNEGDARVLWIFIGISVFELVLALLVLVPSSKFTTRA